jgi:hypothetical protein
MGGFDVRKVTMKYAAILAVCISFLSAPYVTAQGVPPILIGTWGIGNPYDLGHPVGIDASQESYVRNLEIGYTPNFVYECGAEFAIQSVDIKTWSVKDFMIRYNFSPESIGLKGSHIVEVFINLIDGAKACGEGEYRNPGRSIFIGDNKHIVIEVANDYLPLIRRAGNQPLTKP